MQPEPQPVYVNGRLFLGRIEEQKQFRQALQDTLPPPPGEELPYIFLLYGSGGIGKSTLARRFKDIAEIEPSFEGKFFTLWIDWEDERRKHPALKVGRDQISVETVFERIHATIIQNNEKWGRHFGRYQKMVRERSAIEKQAAEILTGGGGTNDEFSHKLVGATTSALAKIIRWQVPIGDTGEKLAQQFMEAGVEIGADQAASLRNFMQNKLQARLKTEQYQLFLNPHEQLTTALAEGLEQISGQKPIIFFLDTYEIVDRTDFWIKELIKAAGPKFIWVIGGRNNLVRSGQFGQEYVHGYAEVFPRRLLAYDVYQLARADVAAYFKELTAPDSLSEAEIDALTQATRGIPLALRTAGEIWLKGVGIAEIVGDLDSHTPHQEIVDQMTARYLLHVLENEADRQAIFALALAKGNLKVLQAMLEVESAAPNFDLPTYLQNLRRNYEAIHFYEARLHDTAAAYILSHLQQEERRNSWNIRRLNTNGEAALAKEISQLEEELPLLEERAEDDDWVQASLDRTQMLFWLEEQEGWKYFIPRFVEGLAYNRDLARGLLEIGARWQGCLSKRGNRRLKQLSRGMQSIDDSAEMIQELSRLNRAGWLQGEHEKERRAILAWASGVVFMRQKDLAQAQQAFVEAERGLPEDGTILVEHLGESLDDLARQMMWPDGRSDAIFAPAAEALLQKAAKWLPEKAGIWLRLGVALRLGNNPEQAIKVYNRSLELDPENFIVYNNRGNAYSDLHNFGQALEDYNQAIQLNPEYALAYNNRGNLYHELSEFKLALTDFDLAIKLEPNNAKYYRRRGNLYYSFGKIKNAILNFNLSLDNDPNDTGSLYSLVLALRTEGEFEEAIEVCLRIVKLAPEDYSAHNGLGYLFIQIQELGLAEQHLLEAIKLKKEPLPYLNLGIVNWLTNHIEEAYEFFHKGLALIKEEETDPDMIISQGWLLVAVGEKQMGIKIIQDEIEHNFSQNGIANLHDWTEAILRSENPPEGMKEIRKLID